MKRHLPVWIVALTSALLALPADAGDDEAARQAIDELWQAQLLAPLPRQSSVGEAMVVAFLGQHRQRLLENVANLSLEQLDQPLSELLPALRWGNAATAGNQDVNYGSDLLTVLVGLSAQRERSVPEWLTEALARRIQQLAMMRATAKRLNSPLVWSYELPDWSGSGTNAFTELNIGAMAWAGPAVRDHAQYVDMADRTRTRIRIDHTPYPLKELAAWTHQHGQALKLSLDNSLPLDSETPMPVVARVDVPVWLITPQGLVTARLTGLHTGNACVGGGWLELEVAGGARPAIWAILFLPEKALASRAVVKRQIPAPNPEAYLLAAHSQLAVSWPDKRLPTLNITAKQFQWRNYPQRENDTPPVLGTAWGTTIETTLPGQNEATRISAAGTPACLPR